MTVPVATILSDGSSMDPSYELLSLEVNKRINRIPDARLTLLDGNIAKQQFAISNSEFFAPGKPIELKLRYEGKDDISVFKGLVVRHAVSVVGRRSRLTVDLKDAAIKLTQPRKRVVFREQTDADAISTLLTDAGLEPGEIATTDATHKELVQFDASDWDFMLARADVLGLVVVVEDGKVSLRKLEIAGKAVASLNYGIDEIHELELELDGSEQRGVVQSVAWSIADQARSATSDAEAPKLEQGNVDPAELVSTLGFTDTLLVHPVPTAAEELQAWADARMTRSRFALISGRLVTAGRGDIKPFDLVELAGISDRFNGTALVGGVCQRWDRDGWRTELELGVSPEWFCHREHLAEAPAAGLLPPISGLQIGIVDGFADDPDGEHRIKVKLAVLDDEQGSLWARLAVPEGGKARGYLFWPELGDEVVVGFFNDDPRQPVVIGALYSSVNTPPEAIGPRTEDNYVKGIVTKAGIILAFNDELPALTIETPAGNKLVIDDDAGSIVISDANGNTVTLDDAGISIETDGDFKLVAGGNVTIEGSAVDVK
jgi:Rhs element Vgr protein